MAPRASTWPSLASLLTGLYPSAHGVAENGYGFPDDLPTLPKLLHGAGYRTGAFLSNMCHANHQGWDGLRLLRRRGRQDRAPGRRMGGGAATAMAAPTSSGCTSSAPTPPITTAATPRHASSTPATTAHCGRRSGRSTRSTAPSRRSTPRDLRHLDALYDAAVMGSDRLAGGVLAGLRAAGRLERTIVILTADHGEELYEHNRYLFHSCSVYQATLHVPLGISAPGLLPPGARVPQTVELIDVMPTLLALLGIAPPAEQHGRSLVPYLERPGGGGPGKPAFSEYGESAVHTVIKDGWKLVDNPGGHDPVCIPEAPPHHYPIGRTELYDLTRDPREQRNLAASDPARAADLARLIRQRFSGLTRRRDQQAVPEEPARELEALGYVAH